jgi:hypothetical protein
VKPLTRRLTTHCTARTCSSTLPAIFNLDTQTEPPWIKIGKSGVSHPAVPPAKFIQEKVFTRVGIPSITDKGLYTEEQRSDMMIQSQRQDAILQVIAHLAHTVVSQVSMWGASYDASSPEGTFQGMIEQSTTPFPYSALSAFPLFLRIIATVIFPTLTVTFLIYPLIKLIRVTGDTTLGWAESLKALLLPTSFQVLAIKKQYKTIASLTANVDSHPITSMYDPADIIHQLTDIRSRLAIL